MLKDQIPPKGSLRDKVKCNVQEPTVDLLLKFDPWTVVIVLEFAA